MTSNAVGGKPVVITRTRPRGRRVDPEARHGRKTSANGFDGYKAHVAVDPDSELITATTVTAGDAKGILLNPTTPPERLRRTDHEKPAQTN